jgi:diaminohydroxyphosphoribosylaminopyrimidine deaminase/5-amino-6-(5-phosphoribosylamino)uracil reductase
MPDMGYQGQDTKYMQSALKLAHRGVGNVEPNPVVGCVIVKAGRVIGRGWHKEFGGSHAEINALSDCKSIGVSPEGSTMYVTLEPCCHEGKTPPCTDVIIAAGVSKVVVAMIDPSEYASGKGIEQLRQAEIKVHVGVCEEEARLLNAPFIKYTTYGKCWVILKWAQSIDSKIAYSNTVPKQWISNELSRKDAHKLRRRVQAVLVGINTVIIDDPLLTPRPSKGKKPVRIVMDSSLRIPLDCRLIKTAKKSPIIVYTSEEAIRTNPEIAQKITKKGAEVLAYPSIDGRSNLYFLLDELSKRGVQQLLVEGGARVLASFLTEGIADEVRVYISPKVLGGSGAVSISEAMAEVASAIGLHHVEIKSFDDDVRIAGLTEPGLANVGTAKGQVLNND